MGAQPSSLSSLRLEQASTSPSISMLVPTSSYTSASTADVSTFGSHLAQPLPTSPPIVSQQPSSVPILVATSLPLSLPSSAVTSPSSLVPITSSRRPLKHRHIKRKLPTLPSSASCSSASSPFSSSPSSILVPPSSSPTSSSSPSSFAVPRSQQSRKSPLPTVSSQVKRRNRTKYRVDQYQRYREHDTGFDHDDLKKFSMTEVFRNRDGYMDAIFIGAQRFIELDEPTYTRD
jgi:hypothetical protein